MDLNQVNQTLAAKPAQGQPMPGQQPQALPQAVPPTPQAAPQGQPMAPEAGMSGEEMGDNPMEGLIAHMDALPEEAKQFMSQYLTPESAKMFGLILGEEAGKYFMEIANPEMVLVPIPRAEVERVTGGQSAEQTPTDVPNSSEGIPSQSAPVNPAVDPMM